MKINRWSCCLLLGVALGQNSKTSPGFSLAKLNAAQCSYAVRVINHLTAIGTLMEHHERITGPNAAWPKPPDEKLDTFVKEKAEDLKMMALRIGGAMLKDLDQESGNKELDRIKTETNVTQREFAYVLELRGCSVEPRSITFLK